jgi:hypothetical protein
VVLYFRPSHKTFVPFIISLMHVTCLTHLISFDLLFLIFAEVYKLWRSALCDFFQPPFTSFVLEPNVLVSLQWRNVCIKFRENQSFSEVKRGFIWTVWWSQKPTFPLKNRVPAEWPSAFQSLCLIELVIVSHFVDTVLPFVSTVLAVCLWVEYTEVSFSQLDYSLNPSE